MQKADGRLPDDEVPSRFVRYKAWYKYGYKNGLTGEPFDRDWRWRIEPQIQDPPGLGENPTLVLDALEAGWRHGNHDRLTGEC